MEIINENIIKKRKMKNKEIYDKVKEEINLMVLECYEGMEISISLKPKIMNFVTKAITRTLAYKDMKNEKGNN